MGSKDDKANKKRPTVVKQRTRAQDGKFTNRRGAKGAPRNSKGKFK